MKYVKVYTVQLTGFPTIFQCLKTWRSSIKLLSRLLRRKFGVQPELETILQSFPTYPLEKLEDLADALLDFNAMSDLETWLADHIKASI